MKFISDYPEFGGSAKDSVNDHIGVKNSNKSKILEYLNGFDPVAVRCSHIYDHVADQRTNLSTFIYSDDVYKWNSSEIYHFEKYDMELDKDFIEYVMSK